MEALDNVKEAAASIPAFVAQIVFWVKIGAFLLAVMLALIALYFIGPSVGKSARWLFGEQSEILDGISHGARLLAWAGIVMIGLFVWSGGKFGDAPGFWERAEEMLAKATQQLTTEPRKEKGK